ncbi:MAG TPA: hypothetical protein ENG63_06860 [Candidatus Desulfofervidus auxilii]|uniref:Uncharacterized protein n=1 Tax=Desulfofervidus auxilii TaxID=1621989 RepID=A0A7C0Y516_DESA2|nr:hypothetical protein [Candidatus Desulfofervidus auxilii]
MRILMRILKKRGLKHIFNVIRLNWTNIDWWRLQILQFLCSVIFRSNNGFYILEEDFDNLIILDACRYDLFKEEIKNWNIKGNLEYRISRGSDTLAFLLENFENKRFEKACKEIVYVSANPFVSRELKNKFYKIIPVWLHGWDEELNTVLPEAVYEAALQAAIKYRGKKLIIHFMQPHSPFIKLSKLAQLDNSLTRLREATLSGKAQKVHLGTWELLRKGVITKDKVIWGYRENIKIVLPYVEKLCKILPGKTVVTADHGEALGEKIHPLIPLRIYEHPTGNIRIESLIKVPWFISEEKGSIDNVEREIIKLKIKRLKR